jgi:8-oxo-dGTP diphosphatase
MSADSFHGVKIALFYQGKLIVYLRDDKPGLRWANMWDLPGGGREGDETAFECAKREVEEEFAISLSEDQVSWVKEYPAMHDPHQRAFFMVAEVSTDQFKAIVFGDEGQRWQLMDVNEYLGKDDTISYTKGRLNDYLAANGVHDKL